MAVQVDALQKRFGARELFSDVSFAINPGERIGLVGRNGHGKSTLLQILLGNIEYDDGEIHFPKDYRLGFLSQHISFTEKTVAEEAYLALPAGEGGWKETYKADAVLHGLGFDDSQFHIEPEQLSGGLQVRLNLAKAILAEPNLLLLDEPTNYLDIVSLRWLATFLQEWEHELVIITHDRHFMDSVTTHTLGIHRGRVRKIEGPTYKLYEQLAQEEEIYEKTRQNQEKKIKEVEDFARRFRAKARRASAVQSRLKQLDKIDRLEKLEEIDSLQFDFQLAEFPGKWVLHAEKLGFSYDDGPKLFSDLTFSIGKHDRVGIIGRNGKGKTTLLRVLTEELSAVEGRARRPEHVRVGYFGQTNVERLNTESTVEQELLAVQPDHNRTIARAIAGAMMFEGDDALKQIKVLSGGEKARVMLGKVIAEPANMLLLDEPTNHLDIDSTEAFVAAVERFPGAVIFVTHSEAMLHRLANRLIVFDGGEVFPFEGNYEDFLHRVGWAEEGGGRKAEKEAPKLEKSKKELRKERAERIQERSRVLKPLEQKVAALEEEIMTLEARAEEVTAELIEITAEGFGDDAAKLSRELSKTKERIEEAFGELEQASEELEAARAEFVEE